jgi:hypothetical protein
VLAGLFLVGGCGGDGGAKLPGGAGAGTRFLTVSVTSDTVACGKCETLTATLTTASGSTQTVAAAWRTDMPSVATIDGSGALTAVAHGEVTVIATYEELQATKLLHVVNDYGGLWGGTYVVTACQARLDFEGLCTPDYVAVGQSLPVFLDLAQDRASVSGDLWLGAIETSFSGSVERNGSLAGESKGSQQGDDGKTYDFLVSPARFTRTGNRIGDGTLTWTMSSPAYRGELRVEARVMGLDPWSGEDAASRAARTPARSIREALRARPGR